MPLLTNPYIAGNPVGGGPAFIGRDDVLREVLRVLRRAEENAIVLYGQRRIGKTSILQHLAARLPAEGPYCPVYFDLQDKAEQSLERVLGVLAQTIAVEVGEGETGIEIEKGEGVIGEEGFRREWLPGVLEGLPEGHSLVLLFDEFDVLTDVERVTRPTDSRSAAARLFPYLRELLAADRARLQFVFVVGRNVADLTTGVLQLFKGTPARRVLLLDEADAAALARLSEKNGTLCWPDDAVSRVWQLTHGHPFLTQMLCSQVWELLYEDDPDQPPTVTPQSVEDAVDFALDASKNTLEWLWNGLGPAERVVASALAEAGPGAITQEQLEQVLQNSGVRVLIRELQNAPKLLQDWDILEAAGDAPDRYRFRVELLRRWLQTNKPLRRVQDDLDRVQPLAENLYQAAYSLYQDGQVADALPFLQRAVDVNPNHVRATLLLTDLLLVQGQTAEAATLLERLYDYHPAAAKFSLLRVWLALAQAANDDDARLAFYAKVLRLDSTQADAVAGTRAIWQQRGDAAAKRDDLITALDAYRRAGLRDKVEEITGLMPRQELNAGVQEIETLERDGKYQAALERAQALAKKFPKARAWDADLERLEHKTKLDDLYRRALGALEVNDQPTAQTLLLEILGLESRYAEATRYLHLAVTGEDVAQLRADMEVIKAELQTAQEHLRLEQATRQELKEKIDNIDLRSLFRSTLEENDTALPLRVWGATDVGRTREGNQDTIFPDSTGQSGFVYNPRPDALARKGQLLIVADGVSRAASQWAIQRAVESYYDLPGADLGADLHAAVAYANASLVDYLQNQQMSDTRCTMTAVVIHGTVLFVANVGNSRTYLIRGGRAYLLTKDHTLTQQKIDQRQIRPEDAHLDPDQSVLTRSMGATQSVQVDLFRQVLQPGDRILLCSDGLHDMLSDAEIARRVGSSSPKRATSRLIAEANRRGGFDNISVVIAQTGTDRWIIPIKPAWAMWNTRQRITFVILAALLSLVILDVAYRVILGLLN